MQEYWSVKKGAVAKNFKIERAKIAKIIM